MQTTTTGNALLLANVDYSKDNIYQTKMYKDNKITQFMDIRAMAARVGYTNVFLGGSIHSDDMQQFSSVSFINKPIIFICRVVLSNMSIDRIYTFSGTNCGGILQSMHINSVFSRITM